MSKATQIGWFTLKEDTIFRNTFECAAWYEDVLVKAGRYPVEVYELHVREHTDAKYNGRLEVSVNSAYVGMEGIIVSDYFGGQYFGVPIGSYDSNKNAGNPSVHTMSPYLYMIAESIFNEAESPWELLPEFEAREVCGEWDGVPFKSYAIYKR